MRITIAQLDPIVGDIEGNLKSIADLLAEYNGKTDLVVFPELFLTGYPPRDLLEKQRFIERAQGALHRIADISGQHLDTGVLFGLPVPTGKDTGTGLYNSAALVYRGEVLGLRHKSLLPVYDVFDEIRYFDPSPGSGPIEFNGSKIGVSICEDMWNEPELWKGCSYDLDPVEDLLSKGADLIVNISASPFYAEKEVMRYRLIRNHAARHNVPFVFVNQVGGNDELVFDGRSMCVDSKGDPIVVFPGFEEHIETVETGIKGKHGLFKSSEVIGTIHDALALGLKDYMRKTGFSKAVVGLSGGIDSAVTCAIACRALGSRNVLGVAMPSMYSAGESEEYSRKLAKNLKVGFKVLPIAGIYDSYLKTLDKELGVSKDKEVGVDLQNIQARIRGNILMAFSNRLGHLLLTTGNKSEGAVGYCTLYGDMAGGLAVISDVPKTLVYELAEYINREAPVIPVEIIERPPSAELRPDQLDQDSLPPYEILDKILFHCLEEQCSMEALIEKGLDPDTIRWVVKAVNRNEYKRRQAPPGIKVTSKAFGTGRRMPIAAEFQD